MAGTPQTVVKDWSSNLWSRCRSLFLITKCIPKHWTWRGWSLKAMITLIGKLMRNYLLNFTDNKTRRKSISKQSCSAYFFRKLICWFYCKSLLSYVSQHSNMVLPSQSHKELTPSPEHLFFLTESPLTQAILLPSHHSTWRIKLKLKFKQASAAPSELLAASHCVSYDS